MFLSALVQQGSIPLRLLTLRTRMSTTVDILYLYNQLLKIKYAFNLETLIYVGTYNWKFCSVLGVYIKIIWNFSHFHYNFNPYSAEIFCINHGDQRVIFNLHEFAHEQLPEENSLALLTVWRVVIEKCVTVVWLKQFSVAHCVACCHWKVCNSCLIKTVQRCSLCGVLLLEGCNGNETSVYISRFANVLAQIKHICRIFTTSTSSVWIIK